MSTLKKDIESLISQRLGLQDVGSKISSSELIPLSSESYLFSWSFQNSVNGEYSHQMKIICQSSNAIFLSEETFFQLFANTPMLTGLQRDLRNDWIIDNSDRLNSIAKKLHSNANILRLDMASAMKKFSSRPRTVL